MLLSPADVRVGKITALGEQADVIDGDAEASTNESGAGERVVGTIAASVRVGDWVLPVRRGEGGCGNREMPEGKDGGGWLRVEVVSVG